MIYGRWKKVINVLIFLAVYLLGLFLASFILNYNNGNSARTVKLSDRKLPVLSVQTENNTSYNFLNGYKNDMDIRYIHDSLTAVGGRTSKILFKITGYEDKNLRIDYELTDYEKKTVYDRNEIGNSYIENAEMFVEIPVKSVSSEDKELMLHMMLYQNRDNPIHYYMRVQQGHGRLVENYISYINDFVEACINKEKKVAQYIEPDPKASNLNFNLVNIHSNFSMITFGKMNLRLIYEPQIELCELDDDVAMFKCRYSLEILEDNTGEVSELEVIEKYRVRKGTDRVVLLNFERKIREFFSVNDLHFGKNNLRLGITANDFEYLCTDDGERVFFKKNRKLWAYNNNSGDLTEIALWVDNGDLFGDVYDIKLLNMDRAGNVDFIVYGYIPSGEHEGTNGIILYRYDAELNSVIERMVINSDRGFAYLEEGIDRLAYLDGDNMFYVDLADKIYSIDLSSEESEVLTAKIIETNYLQVSENKRYLAYVDSDKNDLSSFNKIYLKDLMDGSVNEILAKDGYFLKPLGFLGEDLIYGNYKYSDLGKDKFGNKILPAEEIKIISIDKEVKKQYSVSKTYIKNIEINDSNIEIYRVKKRSDKYFDTSNDRIIYSKIPSKSTIELNFGIYKEGAKKQQGALVFPNRITGAEHRILKPVLAVEKNIKYVDIKSEKNQDIYYVFNYNDIIKTNDNLVNAIHYAYDNVSAVVYPDKGTIWQRTTYDESYLIDYDSIDERYYKIGSLTDSIKGKGKVQNLNGISLGNILYFVKHDIPILADTKGKGKLLLVGYDSYNIIMREYNAKGELSDEFYYGRKDSDELFSKNDNRFCYLK